MYIFKNSMKNLLRNKGRNILIFLILLVTMTAVTTCAIMQQAANHQIDEYIQSFKPAVSMNTDYGRLAQDYPTGQVTNIDGSTYYEASEAPDYAPSTDLLEEWEQSNHVEHAEWWLASEYNSDLKSFEAESIFHEDVSEFYGKDAEFFRRMAVADYEAKKTYYLSGQFPDSTLYKKLYENGHVVTENEAEELAARAVFGDKAYKSYLENGISDQLADQALAVKIGVPGMMESFIEQKEAPTGDIWAYSDFECKESYFTQKLLSLMEGSYPYNQNECLVSNRFAELNDLKIGDTIRVTSPYKDDGNATLELKISGLFTADYFEATADENSNYLINHIITSAKTLQNSGFGGYCAAQIPTYYLKSADDVDTFKQMLTESGLSEYMSLSDNMSELDSITGPIEKVSRFAAILMVVTLILGGAIFLLLTFLAIGERKYEIGVLRSIGMKKNKVIRGFLYETAVIVMVCCILGITVGTAVSQPAANLMLSQNTGESMVEDKEDVSAENRQVVSQMEGQSAGSEVSIEGNNGESINIGSDGSVIEGNDLEAESETVALQAQLSWKTVLVIFAAAFILMIAAVVISGLYITKFEPIKILSDQE